VAVRREQVRETVAQARDRPGRMRVVVAVASVLIVNAVGVARVRAGVTVGGVGVHVGVVAGVVVRVIVVVTVRLGVAGDPAAGGLAHGGHAFRSGGRRWTSAPGPLHYVHMNARNHLSGAHGAQQPSDGERLAAAVDVLALLADRTRLALLRRLGEGEADVTTLTTACDATRTSVSQHLARLRLAGLVDTRRDGRRVIYSLRHGHLRRLVDEVLNVADHRIAHLPPHD
jgi:DNA-binding transcriptional ArsR family regulator